MTPVSACQCVMKRCSGSCRTSVSWRIVFVHTQHSGLHGRQSLRWQESTCTAVFLWHGMGSALADSSTSTVMHPKKKINKPASSCDYCGKTWAHIYFSFSPQKPFTFEVCREFPRWKSLHTGLILLVLLQFIPLFVILSLRVFRSLSLSLPSLPENFLPPPVQIYNHLVVTRRLPLSAPLSLLSLYV